MKKNLIFSLIVLLFTLPPVLVAQEQPEFGAGPTKEQIIRLKAKRYFNAGKKLYDARKYSKAIKYFYNAAKIDKNYVDAWKHVAFCYYSLKKHKYAYNAFNKVLSFDPDDKDAKEFMDFYHSMIEKKKKKAEKREMFDSVWRAAALPGWGQIHNNQSVKGIVIGAAFYISLGLTIYSVTDQHAKVDKYVMANENHEIAYQEAEDAGTSVLIWTLITIGVYGGGIVDAAMNYNAPETRIVKLKIDDEAVYAMASFEW